MATYLHHTIPDVEVEILDGELLDKPEIIGRLRAGALVGIETKAPNYASALDISTAAKELGAQVVFGVVHASAVHERILKHRSGVVDHVVAGFGELPMTLLVKERSSDQFIAGRIPVFNDMPAPDRSFVDMETYIRNFDEQHDSWKARGTNIFTHIGCKYRCVFCARSRSGESAYFRDAGNVWAEIRRLTEEYGIDYVVDFSDTITQDEKYLESLVASKPEDLNPRLHIFSTADGINARTMPLIKRLGATHVFVGVETGNDELAKRTLKGRAYSPEIALGAIETLSLAGIGVTPSFVLGLPGETSETLSETYDLARAISKIATIDEIFACELIPFPGSLAFSELERRWQEEGRPRDTDIFDPEELKGEWANRFCYATPGELRSCVDDILALGKYTITIRGDVKGDVKDSMRDAR